MNCSDCKDSPLEKVLSQQGVEVDYCRQCHGVWLDRGGIYLLARRPQNFSRRLKEADKKNREQKLSPKTNQPMSLLNYPEGSVIHVCDSGGIWIDGSQILKYNQGNESSLNLSIILGCEKQPLSKEKPLSSMIKAPPPPRLDKHFLDWHAKKHLCNVNIKFRGFNRLHLLGQLLVTKWTSPTYYYYF